jgi:hypothetical protein
VYFILFYLLMLAHVLKNEVFLLGVFNIFCVLVSLSLEAVKLRLMIGPKTDVFFIHF